MSSFLDRPVAMAGLGAGFIRFMGFFFPAVDTPLFTGRIWHENFTFTAAQPLAALVVIIVTGINYFSVKMSGGIQVFLTSLKIGTIVDDRVRRAAPWPSDWRCGNAAGDGARAWGLIRALLTALVPAMWAFNGFNDLGAFGEEIKRPEKNIPRAILLGLFDCRRTLFPGECCVLPCAAICGGGSVAARCIGRGAGVCGQSRCRLAHAGDGPLRVWRVACRGADRGANSVCDGSRRSLFPICGNSTSFVPHAQRSAALSGCRRYAARIDWDI